jgi:hypothetical protein
MDAALHLLLVAHTSLLRDLAILLVKVGPNHPDRGKVNHAKSIRRKAVKREIRHVEKQIVAHCHSIHQETEV